MTPAGLSLPTCVGPRSRPSAKPSRIACFNKSPDFSDEPPDGGDCLSAAGLEGGGAQSVLPAMSSCASRQRPNGSVFTGRSLRSRLRTVRSKPDDRPPRLREFVHFTARHQFAGL
jgi:hypothetical protein